MGGGGGGREWGEGGGGEGHKDPQGQERPPSASARRDHARDHGRGHRHVHATPASGVAYDGVLRPTHFSLSTSNRSKSLI